MRTVLLFIVATLILTTFSAAQSFENKSLSVTVYNNNLGVVKDLRSFNLTSGIQRVEISDVAQMMDATSVHIKFGGEVIEQNYQYDLVSLDKILYKYIDKEIQLLGEKEELIEGKLLSSMGGQIVLQKKEGGLLMLPNVSKYRISVNSLPEGLITKPTLVCIANANKAGKQDVEITYQTSGMNWHAEYVAVLDKEDKMIDLNSWVSINNNSGVSYKDATLKLVAGDVNLIKSPQPMYMERLEAADYSAKGTAQFEEKQFFEYHIYNLQRPTTLAQNETKQISLFEAENVKVTKRYLYKNNWGYRGSGSGNKVAVAIEFHNSAKNNLGVPMPKGKVRLYKSDGQTLEFVGEDLIDHTPKDEKIKLKIGDAFDIVAEEVQTDYKRITDKVHETTIEITVKNRKDEDIVVDVERYLGLYWELRNYSIEYEKINAQTVLFKVPVKAGKEMVLKYTVRYNY